MTYYPITIDGVAYPTKAALNSTFGAMNDNVTLYTDSSDVVRGVKIRPAQKIFNAKQEENTMDTVRHFIGNSNLLITNGYQLALSGDVKGEVYKTKVELVDGIDLNLAVGALKEQHEELLLKFLKDEGLKPHEVAFLSTGNDYLTEVEDPKQIEIIQEGNALTAITHYIKLKKSKIISLFQ